MQCFSFSSISPCLPKPIEMAAKLFFLGIVSTLIFAGCEQDRPKGRVLAKINAYHLTLNEFERQLAENMELEPDLKLTRESKKKFLDQLIQKELLIQEAMRLKLDRREAFIRAIERYWQQTLIRDLIDMKGAEISKGIVVTEEEIESRYRKMKAVNDDLPPFQDIREQILKDLKEEQKTRKLKAWIENLKKTATIQINSKLL